MPTYIHHALCCLLLTALLMWEGEGARREETADSGMTPELRTDIVRRQNLYRTMVKATGMLALRWSDKLEKEAAKWVVRCNFSHQTDPPWGENIYRSEFDNEKREVANRGVMSWHVEISYMMAATRSGDPCCDAIANTSLCCNYQQMVWSHTRKVGCALKKCASLIAADKDYNNAWFLACYYEPRGNVAGFKPFVKGAGCSACPFTYDQCEKNLCRPFAIPGSKSDESYTEQNDRHLLWEHTGPSLWRT